MSESLIATRQFGLPSVIYAGHCDAEFATTSRKCLVCAVYWDFGANC
jgi:hypothetical protein